MKSKLTKPKPVSPQLVTLILTVYCQNSKSELSEDTMSTGPDSPETYHCVCCSKDGSVEPSPSLRDELGDGSGDVSTRLGCLDIMQAPACILFDNNLCEKVSVNVRLSVQG